MKVSLSDRNGLMDESIRTWAERRLHFALSRFSPRISKIQATVTDESGPHGKQVRTIRLMVSLRHAEDVVITGSDSKLNACFASVADRAARSVKRAIDRSRGFDRAESLKSTAWSGDLLPTV